MYSDLTRPGPPKGSVWEGKSAPLLGKSRFVKYYNLARSIEENNLLWMRYLGYHELVLSRAVDVSQW